MPFNVAGGNISKIAYENANEAIKKSDEAKATAEEAKELSESVLSGEVDLGVTRTKIDEKLSVLEEQYAPKLTEVTTQLAQTVFNGQGTITNSESNGYFHGSYPFATVAFDGFAQINTPNYDVLVTPISGDVGLIGDLVVYDKTRNGFKVKMTGSAKSVTFLWTVLNPNV